MREYAPNIPIKVGVLLWTANGNPVTGLGSGDVTVTFVRPNGTTGTAALTGWTEDITGEGMYSFTFSAAEIGANEGEFRFIAKDNASNAIRYAGLLTLKPYSRTATALIALRDGDLHARIYANANGVLDSTGTEARITVYNEDGTEAVAEQTDSSPDAQGTFNIVVSPHGLSGKTNYHMKVQVTTPTGTVVSYQGFSTT